MSLNTLIGLQNQATALRSTSTVLEGYATKVSKVRELATCSTMPSSRPFTMRTTGDDWNYHRPRTEAMESAFQAAIAPFEDHILAIMEINFRTEAKKAMMQAESIEAIIAAAITLPEPSPNPAATSTEHP